MRQTSAESREIDLMMRQWKPAKQTSSTEPVRAGKAFYQTARMFFVLLLAASAGLALGMAQPSALTLTRTSLTVTRAQIGARTATIFTAHVTDADGQPLTEESGRATVSFETAAGSQRSANQDLADSMSASLGSAILDGNGNATLSVTSLPQAANTALAVHAVYHPAPATGGTASAAGSLSADAIIGTDASGVPDFTVTASPASLTVTAGQSATTSLTITPLNGFSEQVTLSCASLPTQVTCTFSPVIASTASGAFTSALQVQTQAASGALTPPDFGRGSHVAFAWALPGLLALAGLASLRRRALDGPGVRLVLLLAGFSLIGLGGCSTRYGYIHHPPSVATGTLAGTYVLTINASGNDGSAVTEHAIPLTLQVK